MSNHLRLYEFGKKKLLAKCENKVSVLFRISVVSCNSRTLCLCLAMDFIKEEPLLLQDNAYDMLSLVTEVQRSLFVRVLLTHIHYSSMRRFQVCSFIPY